MVGNTNLVSIGSKTSSLHQFPQDHSSNLKSFRQQQCWQSILAEWQCWQCWQWKLPESALVLFPRVLGPPQSLLHLAQLVHSTSDSLLFVRNMVAMVYSWWWRIDDDGYWWLYWWWIDVSGDKFHRWWQIPSSSSGYAPRPLPAFWIIKF